MKSNGDKKNLEYRKKTFDDSCHWAARDVQYWRVVVPDDLDVKSLLVSELHFVPYSAHPGVQRTIGKVRRYF